jgi:uncharacterized protein YndB with AHSA1/START domain
MSRDPVRIQVCRRYEASPERVFDAWLDPAKAERFLFATPNGRMLRVEIDARVGGRFCIVERRGDQDAEHHGTYLEIDRPRRLVFTFAPEKDAKDPARVAIEITPDGGGCELVLTQEMGAEWAEYAERTKQGWTSIAEGLAAALG